jgi:hypothetical protein
MIADDVSLVSIPQRLNYPRGGFLDAWRTFPETVTYKADAGRDATNCVRPRVRKHPNNIHLPVFANAFR